MNKLFKNQIIVLTDKPPPAASVKNSSHDYEAPSPWPVKGIAKVGKNWIKTQLLPIIYRKVSQGDVMLAGPGARAKGKGATDAAGGGVVL